MWILYVLTLYAKPYLLLYLCCPIPFCNLQKVKLVCKRLHHVMIGLCTDDIIVELAAALEFDMGIVVHCAVCRFVHVLEWRGLLFVSRSM